MEKEYKKIIFDSEIMQLNHPVMDGQHLETKHDICILGNEFPHRHFDKKVDENPEHMVYSAEFS